MDHNSAKASRFVVIAEKKNPPRTEQDVGTVEMKTYVFEPSTSIGEVFEKLFESGAESFLRATLDRISIYPDETTVPEDELLRSLKERRPASDDLPSTGDDLPF